MYAIRSYYDFGAELAEAVTRGRREEFGRFAAFTDPAVRERIPDPNARITSYNVCYTKLLRILALAGGGLAGQ